MKFPKINFALIQAGKRALPVSTPPIMTPVTPCVTCNVTCDESPVFMRVRDERDDEFGDAAGEAIEDCKRALGICGGPLADEVEAVIHSLVTFS